MKSKFLTFISSLFLATGITLAAIPALSGIVASATANGVVDLACGVDQANGVYLFPVSGVYPVSGIMPASGVSIVACGGSLSSGIYPVSSASGVYAASSVSQANPSSVYMASGVIPASGIAAYYPVSGISPASPASAVYPFNSVYVYPAASGVYPVYPVSGVYPAGGVYVYQASGGNPTGMHNASGSYTWTPGTGTFTLTTTTSDFVCDGPSLGSHVKTGVAITATTMIWPNDMTWTRSSGTPGDAVGTWNSTDSVTGNSFALTLNLNGTASVAGNIVSCPSISGGGGAGGNAAKAEAQHWSSGYLVQLRYSDQAMPASSVVVTGYGIPASGVALTYNTLMSGWGSGTPESIIQLGTTYPTGLPLTYTFNITPVSGTPVTTTSTVSCFEQQFVTNISPLGSVTGNPTFSWTGITDPNAVYGVQVNDGNGSWLWANYFISGTSIVYNGPALTPGTTYGYVVSVQSSSTCNNPTSGGGSHVAGSFTYAAGTAPSYSGTYSGAYAGSDTGAWTATVSSSGVVAATVNTGALGSISGSGQVVLSTGALTITTSGTVAGVATFTGTINPTTGAVSGTWAGFNSMSGSFSGTPAPVAGYAGTYSGTFTGTDTGTWTDTISASGAITMTGYSNNLASAHTGSGQVLPGGSFTGSTSTGSTFSGMINPVTGVMSGTWVNATAGGSGSFSGNVATTPALVNPLIGTWAGQVNDGAVWNRALSVNSNSTWSISIVATDGSGRSCVASGAYSYDATTFTATVASSVPTGGVTCVPVSTILSIPFTAISGTGAGRTLTLPLPAGAISATALAFVAPGTGAHTASGTYTWNATTGIAAFNWTSSDFVCNGPKLGTQTKTGVTITATTMTWPNDQMTWTRASGNAGDIVGTWTTTDSTTGNSYTLTVNANGTTMSVAGNIVSCFNVNYGTGSSQDPVNPHWLNISIDDPLGTIQSAVLTYTGAASVTGLGTGILGSAVGSSAGPAIGKNWRGFFDATNTSVGTFNYNAFPTLPITYTLTITDTSGAVSTRQVTYNGFNTNFVSNISPSGNYTGTTAPTFTWAVPPNASTVRGYVVEVIGISAPAYWYWNSLDFGGMPNASSPSALYTGAMPLPACSKVIVGAEDMNGNGSLVTSYLGNNLAAGQICGPSGVTTGQFDGTYTGSWTNNDSGNTATGTFTTTLVNGVFTNTIFTNTSGNFGILFTSGTVSSSGAITATGDTPVQCSSSGGAFTGQITGAAMTMTYSRTASGTCAAESGTITATRTVTTGDTQAPAIPASLVATAASATQVNLLWTPSTDNVGVTAYKVYRNGTLLTTLGNVTSYSDTGLTASTTYSYTVAACDAAGNCSASSAVAPAAASFSIASGWVGSVAASDGTNFLVGLASDKTADKVAAQLMSPSGAKIGSVVALGHDGQSCCAAGMAFDGTNYLMAWEEDQGIKNSWTPFMVYGQFINTSGATVGPAIAMTTAGITFDGMNMLAYGGGKYLLTYTRLISPAAGDTSSTNRYVAGRIVSPDGTLGSEFRISTGYGNGSSVTFDGTSFFVVWKEDSLDYEVRGRFVSPSGTLGAELSINASAALSNPGSAVFDGTNYMVVWTDRNNAGSEADVFGQRVSPAGALVGGVITITSDPGMQLAAGVAFDGTNHLVTWIDMTNDANGNGICDTGEGSCWDIYGQYVGKDGALVGSKFAINTDAGNQFGGVGCVGGKCMALVSSGIVMGQGGPSQVGEVYGAFLTTTPALPDTQAPTVPNVTATANSATQVTVGWTASTDNVGVTGYKVSRGGALLTTTLGNVTSYNDTGLTASTTYSYTVAACDAATNCSMPSGAVSATTQAAAPALTSPTGLTAAAASSSQVNLSWTVSNYTIGVTYFQVYRNGTLVGSPSDTSFNDTGLTASTQYSYTVATCEATNCSVQSGAVSATTQAAAKTNQTISFGTAPSLTVGGTGTVSATATSGLAVSFTSTTTSVCTVSGSTVTGVAAGTCTIAADQVGNANYNAATQVTQNITIAGTAVTLNFVPGWNLVGNSVNAPLTVATTFGDATKIQTVWKWIPATSKWAFYTPSMSTMVLASYVMSKGYDFLTTIDGGEGFWVNAKTAFTAPLPAGTSVSANYFQDQLDTTQNKLLKGWNLISMGDNITPSAFNLSLSVTPPTQGVPLNVTTLWAWDSTQMNWYFYASSLEANGTLTTYITSKNYLDFAAANKKLGQGVGFWVNHP